MTSGWLPTLAKVTVCAGLDVPTVCEEKNKLEGETVAAEPVAETVISTVAGALVRFGVKLVSVTV
jgi:hypothetical protein